MSINNQSGVTLIEIVLSIVIISVAVPSIFMVMIGTIQYSADPMQRQQAINIAQSYMEEIIEQPFLDPVVVQINPPALPLAAPCAAPADLTRITFDDVCDYDSISQVPTDNAGNAVANLDNYTVDVSIIDTGQTLGGAPLPLTAGSNQLVLIRIKVTMPGGPSVILESYRTAHF